MIRKKICTNHDPPPSFSDAASFKIKKADQTFAVAASNFWNSSSVNVCTAESIETFKPLLKTKLYTLAGDLREYDLNQTYLLLLCFVYTVRETYE